MVKKIFICLGILSFYTFFCYQIYKDTKPVLNKIDTNIIKNHVTPMKNEEPVIGKIIIPKIHIEKNLYEINSRENNIEKNVTILEGSTEPEKENSIMFLAAHSGRGKIAYFEELDKLSNNDDIKLIYKEKVYHYTVEKIWETQKNGYIEVPKENKKQLVLTTCSPQHEGYQLIINCIEKKSN